MENQNEVVEKNSVKDLAWELQSFFVDITVLLEVINSLSCEEDEPSYNWERRNVTSPIVAMGFLAETIHDKIDIFEKTIWEKYVKNEKPLEMNI
jgi:hypothetical protein